MRYFIYDAAGQLFGNPNGYRKHSSAQMICTRYRHKLWAIYDEWHTKHPKDTLTFEIKFKN